MAAPATQRESTREAVIRLLQSAPRTAQDLAETLGITAVGVRKHLESLEADGLVRSEAVRQARGRPQLRYTATAAVGARRTDGYRSFAASLVEDIVALEGEEGLERLLHKRNERLRDELATHAATPRERIQELVRRRNEDGYAATIEEVPGSILIREHNCPIYEIASRHTVACSCEAKLFSDVISLPVIREESLVEGDAACTYRVSTS